jgi:ParB/RepB/Spo0J family partition protein
MENQAAAEQTAQGTKEFNKEKHKDLTSIDPRSIRIEKGLNIRGDINPNSEDNQHLMASIEANGVENPLTVIRNKNKGVDGDIHEYLCIDGHRRLTMVHVLIENGKDVKYVDCVVKKHMTDEEIVVAMFTKNDGVLLNPIEKADGVLRLSIFGWTPKQIGERIGVTEAEISNLLAVSDMPMKVKNAIANNDITSTLVLQIARKTKNPEKLAEMVLDLIEEVKKEGAVNLTKKGAKSKRAKVTGKHVKSLLGEKNTVKLLEQAALHLETNSIKGEVPDFFWKLVKVLRNAPTLEKVTKLFEA